MKLIHLSDLHLGKRVNEFSMLEEQDAILNQILGIIDTEAPDGILIAGYQTESIGKRAVSICLGRKQRLVQRICFPDDTGAAEIAHMGN